MQILTGCAHHLTARKATSDNAIKYDTLMKDNLQCGLILRHNGKNKLCYALAYNWLELTKTTSGALQFVFLGHLEFEYMD